jgi:hypothetical protein
VIVFFKDGLQFDVEAYDADGRARPEWAEVFRRPLPPDEITAEIQAAVNRTPGATRDWAAIAARIAPHLESRRPHAIAAVVSRPLSRESGTSARRAASRKSSS